MQTDSVLELKTDNRSLFGKFRKGVYLNILLRVKGLIYIPILVNILSKEDVGIISLIQSISGLLLGVVLLNLPDSSNRYLINKDKKEIAITISFIVNACCLLFLIMGIISYVFFLAIDYKTKTFIILLIALLFSKVINKLSIFVFEVFQDTNTLMKNLFFVEYISLIVLVCLYLAGISLNFIYVVASQVLVVVAISCYYLKKLFQIYPYTFTFRSPKRNQIVKTGIIMLPVSYGTWIIQNSDYIFIERFFGSSTLATYSFAYSLGSLVTGLSAAITFFWYTTVIKMISDQERINYLVKKVFLMSVPLYIAILLFYKFLARDIISLINKDYLSSYDNINILVPGFFLGLLIQLLSGILYASHKEKILLFSWVFGALTNVILNFLFIRNFGSEFASLSTTVSYTIIYLILLVTVVIKFKYLLNKTFIISNISIILLTISFSFYHYFKV